jgi:excisionase family DNA binding protein
MLVVHDVAHLLSVTKDCVVGMIEEGQIEAIDVGTATRRLWRIPVAAYERFIATKSSVKPGGKVKSASQCDASKAGKGRGNTTREPLPRAIPRQ